MSPVLSSPATVRHPMPSGEAAPAMVADAPFQGILVPGLQGSDARHWQTRWRQHMPWLRQLAAPTVDADRLDHWQTALAQALSGIHQPALLIAHGFGCQASVRYAIDHPEQVAGLLLVAPVPAPVAGSGQPSGPLPVPTRVIASTTDPWMDLADSRELARHWGAAFRNGGDLGHINSASGMGEWRRGLDDLRWLLAQRPVRA